MKGVVKPVSGGGRGRSSAKKSARKSARKSSVGRGRGKGQLPKTRVPVSNPAPVKANRASASQSLAQLQMMARSLGIPYGGLSKNDLLQKLHKYHH